MQEKKLIFKKLVALMVMFLLMMLECMPILTNISLAAEDYENSVEVKGYFSGENIENTSSLDCNADNNSITLVTNSDMLQIDERIVQERIQNASI